VRTLLLACAAFLVTALPAAAMEPVQHFNQKTTPGFYKGRTVRYLDFGPLKLAAGNKVAPIWVVTNGTRGQRNIIDVAPGDRGYTPLWRVVMVTWRRGVGVERRTLRSAAAVQSARRAGEVTLKQTATVVNCPVLGFGQRQTTGFAKNRTIAYLDLGQVKLRVGNKVAPIWGFANGHSEQKNVIDVVPGDRGYTPLWQVNMVTWNDGVTPRVLRSAAALAQARDAGRLTIRRTSMVVNCPVV
jgi:hypothetical protein